MRGLILRGALRVGCRPPELQSLMTRAVRNAKAPIFFFQAPPTATPLETATPLATLDPMSGPKTFSDF